MTPDTLAELCEIFAPLTDDISSEPYPSTLAIPALLDAWEAA